MKYLLKLIGIWLCILNSNNVVGQTDTSRYDERVFSVENRLKLNQLVQYTNDSVLLEESFSVSLIEYKADVLDFSLSTSELSTLAHHPNFHLRAYFLPYYIQRVKEESELVTYLYSFIGNLETVNRRHGCMVFSSSYGDLCFDEIYPKLTTQHQAEMNQFLLQTGVLEHETVKLLKRLPKDTTTYSILKQLVVEQKRFFALGYLLDYGITNDRLLVFHFLESNRKDAHFIMMAYPHVAYLPYFMEVIPHYLTDNWNEELSDSYFYALQQADSLTVQSICSAILRKVVPNRRYSSLLSMYRSDWFKKTSGSLRLNTLFTFFPSLDHIDSVDIQLLAESNPLKFDQLVAKRLTEVEEAYETSTAKTIFQYYMKRPTPEKYGICKYVCEHSRGYELWEAYLHFSEYDSVTTASILLKRFYEEHPYQDYPFFFSRIMECISDLGDKAISIQIAPTLMEDLYNCKHVYDIYSYLYLIKLTEDPQHIEQLILRLNKINFSHCENAICRFLLDFFDQRINERLLANYKKIVSTNTITNYEEFQLRDYLLQYGILKDETK